MTKKTTNKKYQTSDELVSTNARKLNQF